MDMIIAAAMLPMLFAVLFATADAAGQAMRSQTAVGALNMSGQQILRSIAREFSQSNPIDSDGQFLITSGTPYDSVRFRIPVDYDEDGDVVGETEDDFEWGASAPCNKAFGVKPCEAPHSGWALWKNYWIQYRVEGTTLYREVLNRKLNALAKYKMPIAKNITLFSVSKSGNMVTVTATFQEQDAVGQYGQARNYSQTYTLTTESIMRNIVDGDTDGSDGGDDDDGGGEDDDGE